MSLIAALRRIALNGVLEKPTDGASLLRFLKRWWCSYYHRPFKDPLLEEYTLEELVVEFFECMFRDNEKERIKAETEQFIEDTKDSDEEWLREQLGEDYMTPEEMVEYLENPTPK